MQRRWYYLLAQSTPHDGLFTTRRLILLKSLYNFENIDSGWMSMTKCGRKRKPSRTAGLAFRDNCLVDTATAPFVSCLKSFRRRWPRSWRGSFRQPNLRWTAPTVMLHCVCVWAHCVILSNLNRCRQKFIIIFEMLRCWDAQMLVL